MGELNLDLGLSRPPWAHQSEEWADSASMNERLLRWDMGIGKTTTGVGWLRLKYRQFGMQPTLIFAPLSTLPGWLREFKLNSPEKVHSGVVIAAGQGKKKMSGKQRAALILDEKSEIVLTNYESLNMPDVLLAMQKRGFKAIILDEIHRIKNPQSKRFKSLISFSDRATFRLGLTGTLILKSYMDIWAPLRFLDKGKRFGKNFYSEFRNKYFVDLNADWKGAKAYPDWQPKPDIGPEIAAKLASIMSDRTKETCLSLPPRITQRIEVPLGAEQQRLYEEMEDDLIAGVESGETTATNALVKLLRMRQIMAGFVQVDQEPDEEGGRTGGQVHYLEDNPRFEALRDLLEDLTPQSKVVVWANFRPLYPKFRALAEELGIGMAELTGDTKDRQGEIDRFKNDPNCRLFLSNPAAGGTGVDGLQHATSYAIYYERSHNSEHYWQSRDRTHRGGSEKWDSVTEYHLVADSTAPLDNEILEALIRKENFAENVLQRVRLLNGRKAAEGARGRRG